MANSITHMTDISEKETEFGPSYISNPHYPKHLQDIVRRPVFKRKITDINSSSLKLCPVSCKCKKFCWIILGDGLTPVDRHDEDECLYHKMKLSTVENQIYNCIESRLLSGPLDTYKKKYQASGRQRPISETTCECNNPFRTCWILHNDVLTPVDRHYVGECCFHKLDFSTVEQQILNCVGNGFLKEPLEKCKKLYIEPLRKLLEPEPRPQPRRLEPEEPVSEAQLAETLEKLRLRGMEIREI
ncbi:uncharacterized protein LOC123689043 [Harmonia axyridis]|uniref:uncharacterized protein LOC123689043 n=1 Tax=Harmonia axyridis TaxID=115357 RepID=UPI001E2783E4|nr:uncharacterized protein LOC123689043 [Harmonia axyridis]